MKSIRLKKSPAFFDKLPLGERGNLAVDFMIVGLIFVVGLGAYHFVETQSKSKLRTSPSLVASPKKVNKQKGQQQHNVPGGNDMREKERTPSSKALMSGEYLNWQMQKLAKKAELESLRMDLDNHKWAKPIEEGVYAPAWDKSRDSSYGVEIPEDISGVIYQDIATEKSFETAGDPMARMDSIVARKKYLREYQRRLREEYVRAFIENAEKDGFEISVNDELQIVGVRLSQPSRPLRLPRRGKIPPDGNEKSPFDPGTSGSY